VALANREAQQILDVENIAITGVRRHVTKQRRGLLDVQFVKNISADADLAGGKSRPLAVEGLKIDQFDSPINSQLPRERLNFRKPILDIDSDINPVPPVTEWSCATQPAEEGSRTAADVNDYSCFCRQDRF
jgi:hypothetical protein